MMNGRPLWSQCVITAHLGVFVVAGCAFGGSRDRRRAFWAVSYFRNEPVSLLTSLVHEGEPLQPGIAR